MRHKKRRLVQVAGEPHAETLFRYGLVCQVATHIQLGEKLAEAVRRVAVHPHHDPGLQTCRRVSDRTLRRWHEAFKEKGFEGLSPATRKKTTGPVTLPEKLVNFCVVQKKKDPCASIPELLRRSKELGLIDSVEEVNRGTMWRTLVRMGAATERRKANGERDTRRYAFPHRLDCVLCDGKHFKIGPTEVERVALIFLDDCTRTMLHVVVGPSESTELFLRGVYGLISHYGLMDILYLDKGPGFTSQDTLEALKNLEVLFIHGETAYPEGHGKVERLNQTVKKDLLRNWRGRVGVDPDFAPLEARFEHYRTTQYNVRGHESLGMRTPWECFESDPKPLDLPESDGELRKKFVIHERRRVSKDHVIPVSGTDYEMPRGYAGSWQTVERHLLRDNRIFFLHEGELIELHPVDLEKNARTKRAKREEVEDEDHSLPKSAAEIAYDRDLASMLDADGGFRGADEEEED